ncbi:TPA: hypothetical protein ACQYE6_002364 [Vibrio parahaemolyticus]
MRVLLLGEYSGVHTNLAMVLKELGHDVITVSDGDGFKSFPRDVDLSFSPWYKKLGISIILDWLGLKGTAHFFKRRKVLSNLNDIDVIQCINTASICSYSSLANYLVLKTIISSNPNAKVFLCALGDDRTWVNYCLNKKNKYSYFDRLKLNNIKNYLFSLKYLYAIGYKQLDKYVIEKSEAIIPGLLDYYNAYSDCKKVSNIIRIPISKEQHSNAYDVKKELENSSNKDKEIINVFHGWQIGKDLRKGNDVLDRVVKKIKEDHVREIEYNVIQNVPYNEYVRCFDKADIFLDQVYSYDRGVNAILGMANGKVVVSGFENEKSFDKPIGINAVPDESELYTSINELILNPVKLRNIKINAVEFIIKNHEPEKIAQEYLLLWGSK